MDIPPTLVFGSIRDDLPMDQLTESMLRLEKWLNQPGVAMGVRLHAMDSADIAHILSFTTITSLSHLGPLAEHYQRQYRGRGQTGIASFNHLAYETQIYFQEKYGGKGRSALFCSSDHQFAKVRKAEDANAAWGSALCGCFSLTYGAVHEEINWHETLHVLGADDCYDKDNPVQFPEPRCELRNCIHRYDPDSSNVDLSTWPFICTANLALIRDEVAKV